MKNIDLDLCSYEELVAARPDLVASIREAKSSTVESISEAAKGAKNRCKMCGQIVKPQESAPRAKTVVKASENLVEMYQALGLSEAEAKIAAGEEEQFVGDVPVSELLKPY